MGRAAFIGPRDTGAAEIGRLGAAEDLVDILGRSTATAATMGWRSWPRGGLTPLGT
jgi:hypothetical protein